VGEEACPVTTKAIKDAINYEVNLANAQLPPPDFIEFLMEHPIVQDFNESE